MTVSIIGRVSCAGAQGLRRKEKFMYMFIGSRVSCAGAQGLRRNVL